MYKKGLALFSKHPAGSNILNDFFNATFCKEKILENFQIRIKCFSHLKSVAQKRKSLKRSLSNIHLSCLWRVGDFLDWTLLLSISNDLWRWATQTYENTLSPVAAFRIMVHTSYDHCCKTPLYTVYNINVSLPTEYTDG